MQNKTFPRDRWKIDKHHNVINLNTGSENKQRAINQYFLAFNLKQCNTIPNILTMMENTHKQIFETSCWRQQATNLHIRLAPRKFDVPIDRSLLVWLDNILKVQKSKHSPQI